MPKLKTVYICADCGYEASRWMGKCPECGAYSSMNEEVVESASKKSSASSAPTGISRMTPSLLGNIESAGERRTSTRIAELDRVFCGGIVDGSMTLVGGEPGIGKSTLLLQICDKLNFAGERQNILYVSGEESLRQIKMRAERLGITSSRLYLLAETDFGAVEKAIGDLDPALVIIDSIQTVYMSELPNAPGSMTQIRECAQNLMHIAKSRGVSVFIIGHVTKEGAIAGPRMLEHMVDTVLYFEGERHESYRIIRAVKNRFGATNEIGVFEMRGDGLHEVSNPSEYMLSGRPSGAPGSAVTCGVEGTRPILAEVQALINYTNFGTPRRTAQGCDYNRITMLIAVIEKRAGFQLGNYDSYVNIAGGIKILEPALDLAAVAAIASSFKNKPLSPSMAIFGEVGLTGEVRAVTDAAKRVTEAAKLGFGECVIPQANLKGLTVPDGVRVFGVANIKELLDLIL